MSYDVSLVINTGHQNAEVCDVGNMTYNVSPMFQEALGGDGLMGMQGHKAKDSIPLLQQAVKDMRDHPDKYKAMNPSNGWGDYHGALAYLEKLLESCKDHPRCTIYIC